MHSPGVRFVLSGLAAFILGCGTVDSTSEFADTGAFSKWMESYYRSKDAAKVPAAIRYYSGSSIYRKENTREPMAVFFGALFRSDARAMKAAYDALGRDGSEDARLVFVNAAWFAATPEAAALNTAAGTAWTDASVREALPVLATQKVPDLLAATPTSPDQLDMLWAQFFATGNRACVVRLLEAAGGDGLVAATARWSVTGNARNHPAVRDTVEAFLANTATPKQAPRIQEILKESGPAGK